LKIKNLQEIKDWTPDVICYQSERFIGFGYRHAGRPKSPYLWSGSNVYVGPGKFSSDGVYSPGLTDPQIGCIPHYKRILELEDAAGLRKGSSTLAWTKRLRLALKTGITALGGLFTAENLGVVKDLFGSDGLLGAENLILFAVIGLGSWFLINAWESWADPVTAPAASETEDGK